MRVTIVGASGLLGKALIRSWADDEVTGLTSKDADIREAPVVRNCIDRTRPECIVLAAAYTDVDGCEANADLAFAVNVQGAVNVAEAAKHAKARLVFLSSDYVFDGTKSSPYETDDGVNPKSVYGRSKAEAENRIKDIVPDCCIVRTSWLFGIGGKCFPDTILRLAESRRELDVVNDQRGCPTYATDLATVIIALCRQKAQGIVHVTNAGECTWFEFATEILRGVHSQTLARPTSSEKLARPAPRPKYSVLSPGSLHRLGLSMTSWQDALSRYLSERNTKAAPVTL